MRLPSFLTDTLTKPEVFWVAVSAVVGFAAVWATIRAPAVQAKRTKKLREEEGRVILPAFLSELRATARQAEAASQLVCKLMTGPLQMVGGAMSGVWARKIVQPYRVDLVRLATFDFPIYLAYRTRIGELPSREAAALTEAYPLLLRAGSQMAAIAAEWLAAEGLAVDQMRNYGDKADAICAVSSRCADVLSERAGSRPG